MKPLTNLLTLSLLFCSWLIAAESSPTPASSTSGTAKTSAKTGTDMIRFSNHDTLHGHFQAFTGKENLLWKSDQAAKPIDFETKKIQRITLNRGQAYKTLQYHSAVHLINGDVIPGKITVVDASSVTLVTDHLGTLTIPRDSITHLSLHPYGGKLLYYGPLNEDGWKTINSNLKTVDKEDAKEKREPAGGEKKDEPKKSEKELVKEAEAKKKENWQYLANAWYAGTGRSHYLLRENALPDQCVLSFKLAWRGTLYANIILYADFDPPERKKDDESSRSPNAVVGNAYILSLTAHSANLSSISFDENGKALTNRLEETRPLLGLSRKDEAKIELRIDRLSKSILIFVDGSFKGKWDLGPSYEDKGNHLAFVRNVHYNNAQFRISDISIAKWNGMKDSAQSMSNTKRDVILLNNGVDRFSGTFKHLRNGQISFMGNYDNAMTIPAEEVQEINLATNQLKPKEESPKLNAHFFVYPFGKISGTLVTPQQGPSGKTLLNHHILGEIQLDTRYINIIDFSHQNSLLELWDDNF